MKIKCIVTENKLVASTTWYPATVLNALLGMFWHKNINVPTRFDQIHQLFHEISSINIILKFDEDSIKGD